MENVRRLCLSRTVEKVLLPWQRAAGTARPTEYDGPSLPTALCGSSGIEVTKLAKSSSWGRQRKDAPNQTDVCCNSR
jgi:hypothetical protein